MNIRIKESGIKIYLLEFLKKLLTQIKKPMKHRFGALLRRWKMGETYKNFNAIIKILILTQCINFKGSRFVGEKNK